MSSGNWLDAAPGIFGIWSFDGKALRTVRGENNLILLECIEPKTGEVLWTWSDWFHPETEHTNGRFVLLNDNILHWKSGWRQYWLDLNSGQTVHKHLGEQLYDFKMFSLEDLHISLGANYESFPGLKIQSAYTGGFYDSEWDLLLMPSVDQNQTLGDRAADITSAIPVYIDGEIHLVISWQQVFPNWNFQSYLGLYNLDKDKWIYEKVVLDSVGRKGILYTPLTKYKETVIANVAKKLICYDYLSGSLVWEREFGHDFNFSGFEISEDILVANCEDENLYGIDPATGDILWQTGGAGTSSRLRNRVLNGVVYFVGGEYRRDTRGRYSPGSDALATGCSGL